MEAGQKVWLVKHALTDGVTQDVVRLPGLDHVYLENKRWRSYKIGRDVFSDYGEAAKAAEALRQKKLDRLRKQIGKLEKLKF